MPLLAELQRAYAYQGCCHLSGGDPEQGLCHVRQTICNMEVAQLFGSILGGRVRREQARLRWCVASKISTSNLSTAINVIQQKFARTLGTSQPAACPQYKSMATQVLVGVVLCMLLLSRAIWLYLQPVTTAGGKLRDPPVIASPIPFVGHISQIIIRGSNKYISSLWSVVQRTDP